MPCTTEFISRKGCRYHAHPNIYDGEPWNDHAMIKWHGFGRPIPALIHTFVDLTGLSTGTEIHIPSSGQPPIKAGVYALVHSFSAIDQDDLDEFPSTMIGQYTLFHHAMTGNIHNEDPILYLVDVESIDSPKIYIQYVGDLKSHPLDRHYLFLVLCKKEWAGAWDTMVRSCYETRHNASIEYQYEKRRSTGVTRQMSTEEQDDKPIEAQVRKKHRHL